MIIDTADDCTKAIPALKAAGVKAVIRYYDEDHQAKEPSLTELRALAVNGFKVGMVYEHVAKPSGEALGYRNASYSYKKALQFGQPFGSAVYFAVDHDPNEGQIRDDVLTYFKGVYRAFNEATNLRRFRVGAYCSGAVADALRRVYPDILIWITCSLGFSGSRDWVTNKKYNLVQGTWSGGQFSQGCDKTFAGIGCDFDEAGTEDWGQFVPWGTVVPTIPSVLVSSSPPVISSAPIWNSSWGPQTGEASWYEDGTNADGSPVGADDMTAAHKYIPFGTLVKVTRTDTGAYTVVRITDRGPYAAGRIIDLRPAAARALDMVDAGVAPVRLDVSFSAPVVPPPKPTPHPDDVLTLGQKVKRAMLALGYKWFPDQNVVTVETMNPDGSPCLSGPNTFDDIKMVLDGDGKVIGGPWEATDHPGKFWTEHPMATGGAFIIALGQQAAWGPPGDYHGHTVWRQTEDGSILGHRDPNRTYKRQGPPIKHGPPSIGVHHHGGYDLPKGDIKNAAAGCMVIRSTSDQQKFMNLTMQNPAYLAAKENFRLTAAVLTADQVNNPIVRVEPIATPSASQFGAGAAVVVGVGAATHWFTGQAVITTLAVCAAVLIVGFVINWLHERK